MKVYGTLDARSIVDGRTQGNDDHLIDIPRTVSCTYSDVAVTRQADQLLSSAVPMIERQELNTHNQ